jgi:predicted DNA-binding protein with PD1-like motif
VGEEGVLKEAPRPEDIASPRRGATAASVAFAETISQKAASKGREVNMRTKQIDEEPKTFVLVLDTGEELLTSLKRFAKEQSLSASSFKAIGALSSAELGWFDWQTKKYETAVKLEEQIELLSLIGDIALKDGEPQIHAHVVVGRFDGTTRGGHLQSATVRPTCELVLTESPKHLHKEIDPDSGLALIRF